MIYLFIFSVKYSSKNEAETAAAGLACQALPVDKISGTAISLTFSLTLVQRTRMQNYAYID